MADIKISELDAVSSLNGLESMVVVQNGETRKALVSQLFNNQSVVSIVQFYNDSDGGDYKNAFNNLISHCQTYGKIAYIPKGTYYMSGTFVINGDISIFGDNAVLESDITQGTFLTIQGNVSAFTNLTEGAIAGRNYIKTVLIPSVDDLIKIRSDQPFENLSGYGEAAGRGEMAVVRNVRNGVVFLHNGLNDSYASDGGSSVECAIVNAARVSIFGNLTLKNTTIDYAATNNACNGLRLIYCRDININVTVINFPQTLSALHHCYGGILNINGYGATRTSAQTGDGSPGYGVSIIGTTMNVKITGTLVGCRHCITHAGLEGVPWDNIISIIGYGARSNAIIDCHYPCGSMIVDGSVLIGGSLVVIENSLDGGYDVDSGGKSRPYGIQFGARNNYIRNTVIRNCDIGILPRAECYVRNVTIENINFDNTPTGISFRNGNNISSWENVIINNVTGIRCAFLIYYHHDMFTGDHIVARNIKTDGYLLYATSGDRSNDDKISFLFENIECTWNPDWGSLYTRIVLFAANSSFAKDVNIVNLSYAKGYDALMTVADTVRIQNVRLSNVLFRGKNFIQVTGAVTPPEVEYRFNLISLVNCHIELTENSEIIEFEDDALALKNLIYSNLYVGGATSVTEITTTVSSVEGDVIFDN